MSCAKRKNEGKGKKLLVTRASLLGARTLLGALGRTTRSKGKERMV